MNLILLCTRIGIVHALITICVLGLHIDCAACTRPAVEKETFVCQEGEWTLEQEKAYEETMATLSERVHNNKTQIDGLLISFIELIPLLKYKISLHNSEHLRLEELLDADTLALIERAAEQKQCRDRAVGIKVSRPSRCDANNAIKTDPQVQPTNDYKRSRIPSLLQLIYENDDLFRSSCQKPKAKLLEPNRSLDKRDDTITTKDTISPTINVEIHDERTINNAKINENNGKDDDHKTPDEQKDHHKTKDDDDTSPSPKHEKGPPENSPQKPSPPHAQPHPHPGHQPPKLPIPIPVPEKNPKHDHSLYPPCCHPPPWIPQPHCPCPWFPPDCKHHTPDLNHVRPPCMPNCQHADTSYWYCNEWPMPGIGNCQKTTYVSDVTSYEFPCGYHSNSYYQKTEDDLLHS